MTDKQSRGVRNNNPLNIRRGDNWVGLSPVQADPQFCQFEHPKFGFRAACKILQTYAARGETTITQIINRWAPPSENHTLKYIMDVSRLTGYQPSYHIYPHDETATCKLLSAMAYVECGFHFDPAVIHEAYRLANLR